MNGYGAGPSDGIGPVEVDSNDRFTSIGGLKEHIKCLREMIIFPLMYPELFKKFKTRPAKGVLFHGPPGTGKTLLARALANECSLVGGRKVHFFMRKGADVMNKYYGESEKNLRMLFQQARKMKPSIIFFDEIDALAPARRPNNDNTHSSVVATLLAEMDGLCDRGDVIVIGATNRPDAMDPAVRRAGRFDRELYFPPPEADARRDILAIYTRDWQPSLSDETLDYIARLTVGYLGSDIKALCSEAVLKAVRRVYPQIYESDYKLLINTKNVEVIQDDMLAAMEEMIPAGSRYMPQAARPLPPYTIPLLEGQLKDAADKLRNCFPPPCNKKDQKYSGNRPLKNESTTAPSVFLVSGECAETLLAPALLAQLEHCAVMELSMSTLHSANAYSPEQAVISLFSECRRAGRSCVIFVRDLRCIWESLARKQGAAILLQLWRMHSVGDNTLMLATCNGSYDQLPSELKEVFPIYKDCIYRVRKPTTQEVSEFLAPVITEMPMVPPVIYDHKPPPPLPRAPIGPRENEADMVRRLFQEFDHLRRLRTTLRTVCRGFMNDRRFSKFNSSINPDALGEFSYVIRQPMDLNKVMRKIEDRKYFCAQEFLSDIDLICTTELALCKLKPNRKGQCYQEAFNLHNEAYKAIAESIDPQLELECQLIARRRREQGDKDDGFDAGRASDIIYFSKLFPGIDASRFSKHKKGVDDLAVKVGRRKMNDDRKADGTTLRHVRSKSVKRAGVTIQDVEEKTEVKKSKSMFPPGGLYETMSSAFMYLRSTTAKPEDEEEDKSGGVKRPMPTEANREVKRPKLANDELQTKPVTKPNFELSEFDEGIPAPGPVEPPPADNSEGSIADLPGSNEVLICSADLDYILNKYTTPLSHIGLEALIDLHAQLSKAVQAYSNLYDRNRLPHDLHRIIERYVQLAKR